MALPRANFAEIKDRPEPLQAGWYEAEVVNQEVGMSGNNNPVVKLRWRVIGDGFTRDGEVIEGTDGELIFDNLTFTKKSMYRVKQTFASVAPEIYNDEFDDVPDPEDLIGGNSAWLLVGIDPGDKINEATGEPYGPRNKVQRVQAEKPTFKSEGSVDKLKF
jgi:hypothetical protein